MASWWKKSIELQGLAFFRGTLAPRVTDMPDFTRLGFTVSPAQAKPGMHWRLKLSSPAGRAEVLTMRELPMPPQMMLDWSQDLTPRERESMAAAGSAVVVRFQGTREDLLRDRKTFLKLLGAVLGGDGLMVLDTTADRFWSPGALADELAHNADCDVQALYSLHVIGDDAAGPDDEHALWVHSHGLIALGLFDFDLIRPHRAFVGLQSDAVSGLATGILEGRITLNGPTTDFLGPGLHLRAVDAVTFDRRASPRDAAARESAREDHLKHRGVICAPAPTGLSRLWKNNVAPTSFFQKEVDERQMVLFSNESTNLASARARHSYGLFRKLMAELADVLPVDGIVKLAYPVDNGDSDDREHMWFTVEQAHADSIDATLAVQPFNISGMNRGDRAVHPVDRLSDWLIRTPVGNVTPRNTTSARFIRENAEKIRDAIANASSGKA